MQKILLLFLTSVLVLSALTADAGYRESILSARKDQQNKDWAGAAQHFLRAARQATKSAAEKDAYFEAAECYLEIKNFEEARNVYAKALSLVDLPAENMVETYGKIAQVYAKEGKDKEAFAELCKVKNVKGLTPDQLSRAYINIAKFAKSKNLMKEYCVEVETIIGDRKATSDDQRNLRWDLANYYLASGEIAQAFKHYRLHRNDDIDPVRRRDLDLKMRDVCLRNNDIAGAEEAMLDILEIPESDWKRYNSSLNEMCAFYYLQGKRDKIAEIARRMVIPESDGTSGAAKVERKSSLMARRSSMGAKNVRRSTARERDNDKKSDSRTAAAPAKPTGSANDETQALRQMAEMLMLAGEYTEAVEVLEDAFSVAGDARARRDILWMMVDCGVDSRNMEKVIPVFNRLIQNDKLLSGWDKFELIRRRNWGSDQLRTLSYVEEYEKFAALPELDANQKYNISQALGDIYRNNNLPDKALGHYKTAMESYPGEDKNRLRGIVGAYLEALILARRGDEALKLAPEYLKQFTESRQRWDLVNGMKNRFNSRYRNRPMYVSTKAFEAMKLLEEKEIESDRLPEYITLRAEYRRDTGDKQGAIADYSRVMNDQKANDWQKRNAKSNLEKLGLEFGEEAK